MKIKSKLFFGIGILLLLIGLLTTLSIGFVNKLSADTENILVANYNTLDYAWKMYNALNSGIEKQSAQKYFEKNLSLQEANITEVSEKELTAKLANDYAQLKLNPNNSTYYKNVHADISDIMLLNMQAIQRKNTIAKQTSETAILWLTITGTICVIIAFTMLANLPGNIANPIKELTESIKGIAAQNYAKRVHFESHNEFGELASSFNTMAQKLEEYQAGNLEKLLIEKKRIETLINNMHDPVIGLDEYNRVLFMNNMALKISGFQSEDVIGKKAADIAAHNDLIRSLVQDILIENRVDLIQKDPIKIYANNKESYFEKEIIPIIIMPTGEKMEKRIGNVILLQNITPYKELDFAKTNFIATVSHELKTPISSIKMSVQLLANKQVGFLNNEQESLVQSIQEDTSRLLKITGELLNITQVESGSIQMQVTTADVNQIVSYAIGANKAAAEDKNIKLVPHIPALPSVNCDTEKASWVLTNLISNAIRYSYDNAHVYIDASEEDSMIKISVTDTGQGIAPEYIDRIFDRYFRIPGTKKEGTGLGLSISKEFIEAQGGTLEVRSEFGKGSTFSILFQKA